MNAVITAGEAMCRFVGRNNDTIADLLDRYLASEEIVGDELAPDPTGEAAAALIRARIAFAKLPRVQQLAFVRRLAQEYGYCQIQRQYDPSHP